MTILPVVARELSVQARRKSTYWIRVLASVVASFLMLWLMVVTAGSFSSINQGKELFSVLSMLAFVYCLSVGAIVTADCLSGEKRDGTIGLLFLTPLKGYDVVFGKLVSSSIHAVFGLLAIVPMMALALLFGGLTAVEIFRTALVLANTLFLSLAAGIFVSTISRNERKAVFGAILLVLIVAAGPYEAAFYLANMSYSRGGAFQLDDAVVALSPVYAFTLIQASAIARFQTLEFYSSLAQTHAVAWVFLTLASGIVPLVCKDRPSGKWKERWTERLRSWTLGDRSRRASFRTRLLDLNPCVWLSFRHRYKSALPWVLITPLTIIGTWICFEYSVAFYESALLLVFTVHILFKVWLTGETCNRWIEDRQSNALELLLCTPLRTKQIVRGQGMALLRQFGWPVAGVMGLTVLAWVGIARTSGLGSLAQGGRTWLVISIPVLIADLIALRWVGLWNGLTARSLNRAVIFTLGRVLFLRWPIYLAITGVASAGAWIGFGTFGLMGHPGVWLVLALSFDGAFALQARRRFFRHFRALAADPSGYNSIHSKAGGGATSGKATRDSAFKLEGTESRPKTTRWSRRRKAAIAAGLLLIVCFSGFAVRRHLYERKLEIRIQELRRAGFPTTRGELERLRPRVADAENTALLLERAFPAFVPPQRLSQTVQRNLPGHMAEFPNRSTQIPREMREAIASILSSNRIALNILGDAPTLERARYSTDWNTGYGSYGVQFQSVWIAANLLLWQIYLQGDSGDVEEALSAIQRLFELGRSFEDEPVWMFQARRADCLERMFVGLEWLLNGRTLTDADLRRLQAEVLHVEQADRLPGILKCIRYFVIEYHGVYPAFAAQFPGGSRQFFEQLRYQLLFQIVERTGTRARDLIAGLDQLEAFDQVVRAPYPQRFEVAKRMDAEVSVKSGFGSRGGILTPQFLYQTLILPDASLTARCRAAITVLAIERYRLRGGGSLPLRLEELVPEFLETIPIDPFDGSPIRFKRIEHGYCVYSVGSDGVDNGGAEVKERRSLRLPKANYDITFTIER
ncbi:MAG: ABC transporter permease subunit [Verrucomicrobia bacterium]|nr:ABC transporter permease subunit [Verrucomicrobiota bacterium]